MKNSYLQENRETIEKINKGFFENIVITSIYFLAFRIMKWKFPGEQKFFMHLTDDQNFMSGLLLLFSLTTICTIILSTTIYLAKRFFLKKYRYIKSNLFFLNNQWITTLNCSLKICGYAMLIMSFVSLQRFLLTIAFISLFNLLEKRRDSEYRLSPGFFSWEDTKLRKLFIYSLVLATLFPLYNVISTTGFIQKIKSNLNREVLKAKKNFPPDVRKSINSILPSIPFGPLLLSGQDLLKKILTSKEAKGGVLIIVLLSFVKGSVDQSISSFRSFWNEVNTTEKRIEWFKLFVNFQLAARNKKTKNISQGVNGFPILCYESFVLSPNFIKQNYTKNIDSFDKKLVGEVENVNEFIKLVSSKISDTKEKSFILYWLFNRINSFEDFLLYSHSIDQSKHYLKHTTT